MSEETTVRNIRLKLATPVALTYAGSNERVQELFRTCREDGKGRELMLSAEEAAEYFANLRDQRGMPLFPGKSAAVAVAMATREPSEEEKAAQGEQ